MSKKGGYKTKKDKELTFDYWGDRPIVDLIKKGAKNEPKTNKTSKKNCESSQGNKEHESNRED